MLRFLDFSQQHMTNMTKMKYAKLLVTYLESKHFPLAHIFPLIKNWFLGIHEICFTWY